MNSLTIVAIFFAFLMLCKLANTSFGDRISHIYNAPLWGIMMCVVPVQYFIQSLLLYIVLYGIVSAAIDSAKRVAKTQEVDCGQTS